MTKIQLLKKIAYLESINDQLFTEVAFIDKLMHTIGFSEGLKTVKDAAQEIMQENNLTINDHEAI